jgi:ABC-type phosphate/phosphonate transport system substrate-binding protein
MMNDRIVLGAVAYDPKVVTIWEGIREYFRGAPVEMDYILFSNYESQVHGLLEGKVDIAWNTNLAYVRTFRSTEGTCRVLAMRDTDLDFRTLLVGRVGEIAEPEDLAGRRLALGSADSAQAAIMPTYYLNRLGLRLNDEVRLVRFDSDVGKHGDTGRSERESIAAVINGEADAAAVAAASWDLFVRAGEVPGGVLSPFWGSPPYSHCNFTTLQNLDMELADQWVFHLLAMSWNNLNHRPLLVLEGLREWVPPQLDGYRDLFAAVEELGIAASW